MNALLFVDVSIHNIDPYSIFDRDQDSSFLLFSTYFFASHVALFIVIVFSI